MTYINGISPSLDVCPGIRDRLAGWAICNSPPVLDKVSILRGSSKSVQRWILLSILTDVYYLVRWIYQVCLSVFWAQKLQLVFSWRKVDPFFRQSFISTALMKLICWEIMLMYSFILRKTVKGSEAFWATWFTYSLTVDSSICKTKLWSECCLKRIRVKRTR